MGHDYAWNALRDTILGFGRSTSYFHQFNASYTIPINKIPLLDWTSASARYGGTYGWDVGPIIPDDPFSGPINLGNAIKNSNTIQLNGQLNFVNLYNKVRLPQRHKRQIPKCRFQKKGGGEEDQDQGLYP